MIRVTEARMPRGLASHVYELAEPRDWRRHWLIVASTAVAQARFALLIAKQWERRGSRADGGADFRRERSAAMYESAVGWLLKAEEYRERARAELRGVVKWADP